MNEEGLEAGVFEVGQFVVGLDIEQRHVLLKDLEAEHLQEQFRCLLGDGSVFGLRAHNQDVVSHLIVIGEQEVVGKGVVEERLGVQLV